MARAKPWLKMWVAWLHDPFMVGLSAAETGCWWRLYALAHDCQSEGRLVSSNGKPLSLKAIQEAVHITTVTEIRSFSSMVDKMMQEGYLHKDGETYIITNYAEEQKKTPSEEKEAVAERVRRYRERQKKEQLPFPLEPSSPKEKEGTSVSINTKTLDQESNGVTPVTSQGAVATNVTGSPLQKVIPEDGKRTGNVLAPVGPVTEYPLQNDPIIKEITRLYEENIGALPRGGVVIEDMIEFACRFKGEVNWIKQAFKEALGRNKRQWRYIQSILERWQEEGGPDGRAGKELDRQNRREADERRRPDEADRRGAPEHGRKLPWKARRSGPGVDGDTEDQR